MKTYIIKTKQGEYYCGKTNNVDKRMIKHKQEKEPYWFSFKKRKEFELILTINGNFEKEIKRFGIKKYVESIKELEVSLS